MQNNQRLFLWIAFIFLSFLIYTNWMKENAPKPPPQTAQTATTIKADGAGIPSTTTHTNTKDGVPISQAPFVDVGQFITIKTDVLNVQIKAEGGDIFSVKLPAYPNALDDKSIPFALMDASEHKYFVSQTGLISDTTDVAPNHANAIFSFGQTDYELKAGETTLEVPLTFIDEATGLKVVKTYLFTRGSYNIDFEQIVTNTSDKPWSGRDYQQIIQKEPVKKTNGMFAASSYTGPVISLPAAGEEYKKLAFSSLKPNTPFITFEGIGGWVSMIQQYFVTAWIPDAGKDHLIEAARLSNGNFMVRISSKNSTAINPNESYSFKSHLYAGPKIKEALLETADNLVLTLDYGWFSPISNIMLYLLKLYHSFVGNWGWSIVLLTLTVKIALFYFADKAYRSMARMRHFAPQVELLKEQYGDDRQKMSQEMMALYRREKINPMGGCWPMLIQIPIFISLFWMLQESVELRQAPWILWIHDLSVMDPYFVMPLIMGATMFIQQTLNPKPPDPMQAKIMQWMPVVFTAMFLWFASGIVLYWIINNSLSIIQQWVITKRVEKQHAKL